VPLEVRGVVGRVRVMGPEGALLAVAEAAEGRRLRYLRVLAT
jgi:tRNA pseudouridine55 synthase